jgi:hypothetical protein
LGEDALKISIFDKDIVAPSRTIEFGLLLKLLISNRSQDLKRYSEKWVTDVVD